MTTASARKSSPKLRVLPAPRPRRAPAQKGVVGQVQTAFRAENRLATSAGVILGGFIPLASFVICHGELPGTSGATWATLACLIAGGLLFSAKTVWQWARAGFADPWKATGFVLLVEGTMVLSGTAWLAYAALGLLITINGIATGVTLSRGA